MSLRSKITAIVIVPMIVLLIATLGFLKARQKVGEALTAERAAVAIRVTLQHVVVDLTNAETGTRGYLLTGDAAFLEPFTQGVDSLPVDLAALTDLTTGDPVASAEILRLQELTDGRIADLQTSQAFVPVTGLPSQAPLIQDLDQGSAAMDEIRRLVGRQQTANLLAQAQRDTDAANDRSLLITIVGVFCVLASLAVAVVMLRRLTRRLARTEELAHMLDVDEPLGEPSGADDEFGRIQRVLVRSSTRLLDLQDELRDLGTTDALTHLTNRRGFLPAADHQLEVAKRTNQPLALMYLDLDALKQVNDRLGHPAGDGMLTEAAFVLTTTFRASDLVARMGGDEFCVLFPSESYQTAMVALARLQAAVDEANERKKRPFRLSFSAGLAMFDPEDPCTLGQLISLADSQMYASKRAKNPAPEVDLEATALEA